MSKTDRAELADVTSHVWVYNTCIFDDQRDDTDREPCILLTRRAGYENVFWHLASVRVAGTVDQPDDFFHRAALVANKYELSMASYPGLDVTVLWRDDNLDGKTNSSCADGVGCVHVLVDHGVEERRLPNFKAQVRQTEHGLKGVTQATWAFMSNLGLGGCDKGDQMHPLAKAASQTVGIDGMPLRSQVARVLGSKVVDILDQRHSIRPVAEWLKRITANHAPELH